MLRLGLVGRGQWGQKIERTLLSFPNVSVIPIAKGDGPPAGLDGVLIATQSAIHAEIALPYIESGIATFIEKPMATAIADAERIREAARRSGAVVFVGHVYLYHPAFLAALELLPTVGEISHLFCEGMNDRPRPDLSVLWDWLPHDLSMARAIFGRGPDSVATWSLAGLLRPEAAIAKFQFGETPVISTVSWLSSIRRKQLTIVGDKGMLIFDDKAPRQLMLYGRQSEPVYPAYSNVRPLTQEMGAFLQAISSGNVDGPHLELGADIVRAIVAAEQSIRLRGQSVTI